VVPPDRKEQHNHHGQTGAIQPASIEFNFGRFLC
jgi:hypothetical protein